MGQCNHISQDIGGFHTYQTITFINDLPDVVTGTVQIFADDTKIYKRVNDIGDEILLHEDLNKLHQWSVKFNAKKCKVMHLGTKNSKAEYMMDGTTLESVKEEKDLGVLIYDESKFHKHVSAAISKANQTLGIVKRTFDKELLPIVYKHQVRPHLEYGNAIWHPRFMADMKNVEGVQHRATKIILELRDEPFQERLQSSNLY